MRPILYIHNGYIVYRCKIIPLLIQSFDEDAKRFHFRNPWYLEIASKFKSKNFVRLSRKKYFIMWSANIMHEKRLKIWKKKSNEWSSFVIPNINNAWKPVNARTLYKKDWLNVSIIKFYDFCLFHYIHWNKTCNAFQWIWDIYASLKRSVKCFKLRFFAFSLIEILLNFVEVFIFHWLLWYVK